MILGQKLGLNWTRQGTRDMMLAVDTDGSGTVDMNELWHWVEEVNGARACTNP
jgi:Ca2+-binding EF-hand superfamily protein